MFCDKFKKLRLKNDYTQAELAKKLNVSQPTVASWEAGKRIPKWKNIKKIAEIFNVSPESLIDEMEEKPENETFISTKKNIADLIFMAAKVLYGSDEKTKKMLSKALEALLEFSEEGEDHAEHNKTDK
ncbi:MAG TPA: hypothetical protein DF364_05515 [Ruminococcaceae bacterium]|jgi:transcriptional regulator with XRE-family HTH domain|nr:hypothetical protein [Oscillospiraceae bacterium]